MTQPQLVLRNLRYHWRGNLAVLLGIVVATVVLTGALLVGDSLRGSLRELTLQRLGWVDEALVTPRFFRAELADELVKDQAVERAAPVLLLQGSAQSAQAQAAGDPLDQAGVVRHVNVLGVDDRFWGTAPPGGADVWKPKSSSYKVYLNAALRKELGVAVGDEVIFSVQKKTEIQPETPLGRRDDVVQPIKLKVAGELSADQALANFSLTPSTEVARTAFIPLRVLQDALNQPGKVNGVLVSGVKGDLNAALKKNLTLADYGLVVRTPASRVAEYQRKHPDRFEAGKLKRSSWDDLPGSFVDELRPMRRGEPITAAELEALYARRSPYLSLESTEMFLPPRYAQSWAAAAQKGKLATAPTLVYLANSITDGKASIPYSIVAGIDASNSDVLKPFLPAGKTALAQGDNATKPEIVLVDWKDSPLQAKPGDTITLRFFAPDSVGPARETTQEFIVVGPPVPLSGATADPNVTPPFPGVTDKLSLDDWDPPFPYDNTRVKEKDDRFWKDYRTTPKAYINLDRAQTIWKSRFGNLTSVRLYPATQEYDKAAQTFDSDLRDQLQPSDGGFQFLKVKQESLDAGRGGDFAGLFLGFSFFLIVAALLLVGLLFRLNLDRRAGEIGLLLACGHPPARVRWLYLGEANVLVSIGCSLGGLLGIAYANLLLEYLRQTWPGGEDLPFLRLYIGEWSLIVGVLLAAAISLATVWWVLRVLRKIPPRSLLQGQTQIASDLAGTKPTWSVRIALAALVLGIVLLGVGPFVSGQQERAGCFFGGGALLLTAGLSGFWAWMRRPHRSQTPGRGLAAVTRLGLRNATRYPMRSLLTAGLLAAATFLVVAAECFRRDADANYLAPNSGSGGFALLGESELPLYIDFNNPDEREKLLDRAEALYEKRPLAERKAKRAEAKAVLDSIKVYAFRVKSGDDASCLNLYKPQQPRILGVQHDLVERGGFSFASSNAQTPEQKANPWRLLEEPDGRGIPVVGEQNTVMWMLRAGLGSTVQYKRDTGDEELQIVGLLHDSVFQSSLLMSEKNFLAHYPQEQGYRVFLIETPPGQEHATKRWLEALFVDQGMTVTPTQARLEAYLAVENMYLSTFQVLGGLGLLLGSLGLGVVLLRSVWERRAELALLRALGFRSLLIGFLVLAENGFLLLLGLAIGTGAAVIAVVPQMLIAGGSVPWVRLLGMVGLVLVVGLAATVGAVASTVRAALIPALRRE